LNLKSGDKGEGLSECRGGRNGKGGVQERLGGKRTFGCLLLPKKRGVHQRCPRVRGREKKMLRLGAEKEFLGKKKKYTAGREQKTLKKKELREKKGRSEKRKG